MRITVPLNLDQRSPRQRAHPVGVAPLGLSSHSKQGDSPRSALTSGSTGSAGRGSDHKRCSDAARSMQLNREVCGTSTAATGSVAGRWPCGPGYARYPQAGRDDSRFPRSGPSVCRKKARHWRRAKSREYKTPQVAAIGSYIGYGPCNGEAIGPRRWTNPWAGDTVAQTPEARPSRSRRARGRGRDVRRSR